MRNVLISGASIAGPTLAYWLNCAGFQTTVVERAPAPRPGGQPIDVRGPALTVLDRMGLLDRACGMRTRLKGMSVLGSDGQEIARHEDRTISGGRFDASTRAIWPCIQLIRQLTRACCSELQPSELDHPWH
jgi:2-polyprenyl-6-methoxyphenol hydroxylase-like FAD-dependent oxidoreductase